VTMYNEIYSENLPWIFFNIVNIPNLIGSPLHISIKVLRVHKCANFKCICCFVSVQALQKSWDRCSFPIPCLKPERKASSSSCLEVVYISQTEKNCVSRTCQYVMLCVTTAPNTHRFQWVYIWFT
jgi:hypothetical protein